MSMTIKKRGLGRGLDALLGGINREPFAHAAAVEPGATNMVENPPEQGELRRIAVDLLQPGKYQPRHNMHTESLEDLASSIKAQGVVQPIVVRAIGGGRYKLLRANAAGVRRRWRNSTRSLPWCAT